MEKKKHRQDYINGFPPPTPHSMLFGRTRVSSGEPWWQSNIDKGERGKDFIVVLVVFMVKVLIHSKVSQQFCPRLERVRDSICLDLALTLYMKLL